MLGLQGIFMSLGISRCAYGLAGFLTQHPCCGATRSYKCMCVQVLGSVRRTRLACPLHKNPVTCVRKNLCMKESLAYVQRKKSPLEKCRPYTFSRPLCPQKQSLPIRQLLADQKQKPAHETEGAGRLPPSISELWAAKFASPCVQSALSFSCCGPEAPGTFTHPSFHAAY